MGTSARSSTLRATCTTSCPRAMRGRASPPRRRRGCAACSSLRSSWSTPGSTPRRAVSTAPRPSPTTRACPWAARGCPRYRSTMPPLVRSRLPSPPSARATWSARRSKLPAAVWPCTPRRRCYGCAMTKRPHVRHTSLGTRADRPWSGPSLDFTCCVRMPFIYQRYSLYRTVAV